MVQTGYSGHTKMRRHCNNGQVFMDWRNHSQTLMEKLKNSVQLQSGLLSLQTLFWCHVNTPLKFTSSGNTSVMEEL